MQARWQNPTTGSFLSVDPLVGNAADPQSYNGYSYARSNPLSYTDPTGRCPTPFACGWWSQGPGGAAGPGVYHVPDAHVQTFTSTFGLLVSNPAIGNAAVYWSSTHYVSVYGSFVGAFAYSMGSFSLPTVSLAGSGAYGIVSRESDPGPGVRETRAEAALAKAADVLPADSKYDPHFAGVLVVNNQEHLVLFDNASELGKAGASETSGATFHGERSWLLFTTETRVRLYAGSGFGGTYQFYLPNDRIVTHNMSGQVFALYSAFHEAGHFRGIHSDPGANAYALGELDRLGLLPR